MTTEEFFERFPAGSPASISTPARTHWLEMIVLFAGVFFGGTGVWPWFTAGEPMASIVFFSSVCAFGLGVFFYETYRHYNSFVGYLKDLPEEDGDAEVSTH